MLEAQVAASGRGPAGRGPVAAAPPSAGLLLPALVVFAVAPPPLTVGEARVWGASQPDARWD